MKEIELCGLDPSRIGIDEKTGIIEEWDLDNEKELGFVWTLGVNWSRHRVSG